MAAALVSTTEKQVEVGSFFPNVPFYQRHVSDKKWIVKHAVTVSSTGMPPIFQQKKIVIFGVPGAHTPKCSQVHLPGFVKAAEAFQKADIGLYCFSTNSVDVLSAWIKANDGTKIIGWLPDPKGDVTRQLGLGMNSDRLGFVSKRFAMILEKERGEYRVKHLAVEQDAAQCVNTSAEAILKLAMSGESVAAPAATAAAAK